MAVRATHRTTPAGAAFAFGLAVVALAGCRPTSQETRDFPRAETFYVGGPQWGEPTSFNPLTSEPAWPVPSADSNYTLLYESLLSYDSETGKMKPLLAESYAMRDGTIEVTLDAGARWNDGKPVTGWDVKYTFELGLKYKALKVSSRWAYLKEIRLDDEVDTKVAANAPLGTASYPRKVVFVLSETRKNPLVVLDALQETPILPKHVLEPLLAAAHGDIDEVTKHKMDHDPVGSGPYRLHSYGSEKIVLVRHDGYWGNAARHGGKLPAPRFIIDPIYKSNDNYSVALQQGRIDASICYMPRIWLKHEKGVRSWYDREPYFVSASIPMLIPNVTHKPLDDVAMRRAMAFAINYRDIRELAVSGYSEPLRPGLILPFGLEGRFFSEEDAAKHGATYDPLRARTILREAGYVPVFDARGDLVETRDARGNVLPTMYIKSPTGWSDWEAMVSIAVKSMRTVGIDVRERFVDASLYYRAQFSGDFDLFMHQPSHAPTPSQPWGRFDEVLSAEAWAPEGDKMYKNIGRFNNPAGPGFDPRIDALLRRIPTLEDPNEIIAGYRELNVIAMQLQPTLPLVYRPDQFYEVSIRHWENFPNAKNPYLPPQIPGDRLGTETLWALRPAANP